MPNVYAEPTNIANVFFVCKVIEKIVAAQLTHYLDNNGLLPTYQSGFRKGHSMEPCSYVFALTSMGLSIRSRSSWLVSFLQERSCMVSHGST